MFIDTNAYIGQWPFRSLPDASVDALLASYSHYGVEKAWTGNFDGLFHKDVAGANARLVESCAKHDNGILVPFGTVNPTLPNWEDDLRRCSELHGMKGIRIHPNYHGYTVDNPVCRALLKQAAESGLLVQLVVTMEDERMMHPLMRVPHVDVAPLAALVEEIPTLRIQLLNAFRAVRGKAIDALVATGQISFDMAWLEGIAGIERMSKQIPMEQMTFGSYAPFFYFQSSMLKLQESALTDDQLAALQGGNAEALLK